MKSKSYKKAKCCYGPDCDLLDYDDDEPCWGRVKVCADEWDEEQNEYYYVHRCQGHTYWGDEYIKEP